MKKTILFLQAAVVGLLAACNQPSDEEQLRDEIQYVNPFIGTGFHGHTFPGATRPSCTGQPRHTYHGLGCQ
jgi:putative alpha-1,2-mannosidase